MHAAYTQVVAAIANTCDLVRLWRLERLYPQFFPAGYARRSSVLTVRYLQRIVELRQKYHGPNAVPYPGPRILQ
jgi:hypothetical protein